MKRPDVKEAIAAAKRFIVAANVLMDDPGFDPRLVWSASKEYHSYPSAKGGAARRASVDLTRALTAMRKP